MDWRKGGLSGSLDLWARRNAREQMRAHPKMHLVRYGPTERMMRGLFSIRTFGGFIGLYLLFNLGFGALEIFSVHVSPEWLPAGGSTDRELAVELEGLMLDVSSYLLGAQIGLLGVISLSLTLVTLIAQREGSSTDIQLYYHESLALELVASCVALSVVLCAQFVWPLQMLLYHVGLSAGTQVFKLTLFSLHLLWLLVNLCVAAYFIIITFRFVQQSARERFRDRYTAYVVLPRDLGRHLREQLYLLAVRDGGESSPSFVFAQEGKGVSELTGHFNRPTALSDVRMAGVNWVVRRWRDRCRRNSMDAGQEPCLFFAPLMDEPMHGAVTWCRRRGGVPLAGIEKLVLRWSFRFRQIHTHQETPPPSKILEGLIENAIAQVDRQTPVAFDSAMGELIRYHQFLLGLSVARGADGALFSFTALPGFGWHPPHRPWSTQYRRLFRRAANYIGDDPHFFRALIHTPHRLMPRRGEAPLLVDMTRELFRLGPMLTASFESWVALRQAADESGASRQGVRHLSGLDAAIHRELVPAMVEGWEAILRDAGPLHRWPDEVRMDVQARWRFLQAHLATLMQHLEGTAHSLLIAIHHGDAIAAIAFHEALTRWPGKALEPLGMDKALQHQPWLHPVLAHMDWAGIIAQGGPDAVAAEPQELFACMIYNIHADVLFLTAAVLLSHAMEHESDALCAEIAGALLAAPCGDSAQVWPASFCRINMARTDKEYHPYEAELEHLLQGLGSALAHPPHMSVTPAASHTIRREDLAVAKLALLLFTLPEQDTAEQMAGCCPQSETLRKVVDQHFPRGRDDMLARVQAGLRLLCPDQDAAKLVARLRRTLDIA